MQEILVLATGIVLLYYFYIALQFSIEVLNANSLGKISSFVFALVNTGILMTMFYGRLAIAYAYPTMFLFLILEFKLISQENWSKALFGTTAFLLNWSSVNLIVFTITAFLSGISASELYKSDIWLSIIVIISYLILYLILQLLKKIMPVEIIRRISVFRIYSSIMSSISLVMILYLTLEWWMLFVNEIHWLFVLSAITTVLVASSIFYFLFYFSSHLVKLHPFKRKSDVAKRRHSEVLEQKLIAETKMYTDDLTKLFNLRLVNERVEELCSANDISFSIIYGDLLGLKHVNDNFGHIAGDRYIKRVAQMLRTSVRASDICARIGGDEFVVILVDTDELSAPIVVEKISKNIQKQKSFEEFKMYMTFGYTYVDKNQEDKNVKAVLGKAETHMRNEKALYYKRKGRGEVK